MDIIVILLLCCIITCSISSSTIAFYWYDEVQKLKSVGETAIQHCKNNNNLLFRIDNTRLCPYGRDACKMFRDAGFSDLYCPLNYNFVIDDPKGFRNTTINSILQFNNKSEDIFNSIYFIKKDLRTPVYLYVYQNISKIQDIYPAINVNSADTPNNNKFINVKSGDLIKISKSSEVDASGKKYDSYYLYVIYDLIITLPIGINLGLNKGDKNSGEPIVIKSLLDLKKAFAKMESSFQVSLVDEELSIKKVEDKPIYVTAVESSYCTESTINGEYKKECLPNTPSEKRQINEGSSTEIIETTYTTTSCDNVPLRLRQPKTVKDSKDANKYSAVCFFYEKNDIGTLISLLGDILIKYIDKSILNDYLEELKNKIKSNITITIFEYIMYIGLVNYLLENSNYKFVLNLVNN